MSQRKVLHLMPLNIDAYLRATTLLSGEEKGACVDVSIGAWTGIDRGWPPGCVPDDDEWLCRLIGGQRPRRAIRAVRLLFRPSDEYPGFLEWPPLSAAMDRAYKNYDAAVSRMEKANQSRSAAAKARRAKESDEKARLKGEVESLKAAQFSAAIHEAINGTTDETLADTLHATSDDTFNVTSDVTNQKENPLGVSPRVLTDPWGETPHGGRESLPTTLHSPEAPPAPSVAARGSLSEAQSRDWRQMLAAPSLRADAAAAPREHRAATGDPEPPSAAEPTAQAHPEAGTKQADEQRDDWQRSIMAKRDAKRAIVRLEPSE